MKIVKKGVLILEQNADRIPDLYNILGDFFYYGTVGIQQDKGRARGYYIKGDQAGCLDATLSLGILACEDYECATEEQKPILRDLAIKYFRAVKEANNPDGYYSLGDMYLHGRCDVPKDLELARQCFTEAVAIGDHIEAGALLAMMAEGYTGERRRLPSRRLNLLICCNEKK